MIATSGLVSRIHSCDFSKPENTRFQYGSSVLPLSSAAPMAGTCDEPTPAMILATAYFRFAVLRLAGLDFGLLDFWLLLALALAAGFFVALFAVFFAAPLFASPPERNAEGLFLPVRERLPSTERPPPSIMSA